MLLNSRKHKDINHIALHGVRNYQKAISILRLYPLIKKHKNEKYKVNYSTNRILKLRESLKEDKKMGFNEQKDYEVFLHWDNKRELIDGGKDSLPLKYANIWQTLSITYIICVGGEKLKNELKNIEINEEEIKISINILFQNFKITIKKDDIITLLKEVKEKWNLNL